MSVLIKSNKMSEVSGALANLSGIVSIQDIVDTILQISNLKSKTLDALKAEPYGPECNTVRLSDIFIDMDYQRAIRLRLILDKLKSVGGFDSSVAGAIDISIRPSGKYYAWDGLRRAIMAGLCGLTEISASVFRHNALLLDNACKEKEAKMFKIRNANAEKMKPEEIFKSMVAYNDPDAMSLLNVLKNAGLDVEGLNPNGKVLGGFAELQKNFNLKTNALEEKEIVTASQIIQNVYPRETNVSVYLLVGLAWMLRVNEDVDSSYDEEEIIEAFQHYVQTQPKQTSLTRNRINQKQRESVAYAIAKNVLRDNNGLIANVGLDSDDVDTMEAFE
jgi:hypothetical protein